MEKCKNAFLNENGLNRILLLLCATDVSICGEPNILPSTYLADQLDVTVYAARKELKRLKAEGLVVSDRYCCVTEDGNFIVAGFCITAKAKQTSEYASAWERERKICKEIWDIDIGEQNAGKSKENHDPVMGLPAD